MVKIKRTTNGDSRVAEKVPTFNEFEVANAEHMSHVYSLMRELSERMERQGKDHDWSKVIEPYKSMFYRDLCNSIEGNMDFIDGKWVNFHYQVERHHLLRNVPDDVDLIDVMEMVCDYVAAGLARSGEVELFEIDESILSKALHNTVAKIKNMCCLED